MELSKYPKFTLKNKQLYLINVVNQYDYNNNQNIIDNLNYNNNINIFIKNSPVSYHNSNQNISLYYIPQDQSDPNYLLNLINYVFMNVQTITKMDYQNILIFLDTIMNTIKELSDYVNTKPIQETFDRIKESIGQIIYNNENGISLDFQQGLDVLFDYDEYVLSKNKELFRKVKILFDSEYDSLSNIYDLLYDNNAIQQIIKNKEILVGVIIINQENYDVVTKLITKKYKFNK